MAFNSKILKRLTYLNDYHHILWRPKNNEISSFYSHTTGIKKKAFLKNKWI